MEILDLLNEESISGARIYALTTHLITPHAQRERGKVIGCGVHIIMFVDEKKFESYFKDRLTFSNIRSRTSRRIYRLALPIEIYDG